MALLKLPDSGQETQIPDEIARDDNRVKEALALFMPGASNLEISRAEKDGVLTVSVIKKAGTKGGVSWDELVMAPEEFNPILVTLLDVTSRERHGGPIDLATMMGMETRIEQALRDGSKEEEALERALNRLKAAQSAASSAVPVGF